MTCAKCAAEVCQRVRVMTPPPATQDRTGAAWDNAPNTVSERVADFLQQELVRVVIPCRLTLRIANAAMRMESHAYERQKNKVT